MADFQASFTNATTAEVQVYGEAGTIHATDSSNYTTNSEDGHGLADFSVYRRVKLTMPDTTERVLCSITEVGATLIDPAATAATLVELISQEDMGDWDYEISLYSVPTYDLTVTYGEGDCVCLPSGVLYKALQSALNQAPASPSTYWELVDDPDDLSSKYIATVHWSVTYDTEVGWMRLVAEANRDSTGRDLKLLPNNLKFLSSLKLNLLLDAVGDLTEVMDWVGVQYCITQAKEILNDGSYS
jgi:hypothetical protein